MEIWTLFPNLGWSFQALNFLILYIFKGFENNLLWYCAIALLDIDAHIIIKWIDDFSFVSANLNKIVIQNSCKLLLNGMRSW